LPCSSLSSSLQGLILSNALRAQKSAEDESCAIALNNLWTEVIELRIEGLEKDKILISLVDKIKEDETKYNAQAEAWPKLMRSALSQAISKRSVNTGEKS
jgi:hypothetical protein